MDNQNNKKKDIEQNQEKNIDNIVINKNKKIKILQSQLSFNQNKINDIKLRTLAKIENIKKSTKEQIKNIKKTELEKFIKTIIPIIDILENILTAYDSLNKQDQPLIEGIKLTLKSLLNILYKNGVKIEGKENEPFNPELHTSILVESSLNIAPNHIVSVKKHGFTLNKILLRKAIVTISKK